MFWTSKSDAASYVRSGRETFDVGYVSPPQRCNRPRLPEKAGNFRQPADLAERPTFAGTYKKQFVRRIQAT